MMKAQYIVITAVATGLNESDFKQDVQHRSAFYFSISKQKITTFEQIKLKAEKYIWQSDTLEAREKNRQSSKQEETTTYNTNQGKKRDRGPACDRLGPGVK